MSDLAWTGGEDFETLFKKATEALTSLRRRRLERRLDAIQIEIGQAEREQDAERVLLLYQQKTDTQRRRLALSE
jgi:thiamine monophosphate kinase